MKTFFQLIFGGLFAVLVGFGIAYGGSVLWDITISKIAPNGLKQVSLASVTDSIIPKQLDGTYIFGFKRTIKYFVDDEEVLIDAATLALPLSSDDKIGARSYIVRNLTVGDTTIEKYSDRLMPIASITKLVTAVVARELLDPDTRIIIGPKVLATYGQTAGFKSGEIFRAEDLIYPLLMVSSNDAAEALAMAYDRKKFIRAMNDWAQSIGAYRTYFADPSGLSADNVSTAKDITIILDWIRKNDPEIIRVTELKSKTVRNHTWVNPTHFLNWSYYAGGKNGYTEEADRTSAALFTLGPNKNVYAIVVLGSSNRDADMTRLIEKVRK